MSGLLIAERLERSLRRDETLMLSELEELVSVETPTSDVERCRSGVALVRDFARRHDTPVAEIELGGRPHLLLGALASGDGWGAEPQPGQVLLVGHIDTVWPIGTLAAWPFALEAGVATGPGVYDMKAGVIESLHALRELRALGAASRLGVLLTTDEEVGSPSSAALVESLARRADAVLVLEPGPLGAVKVARKGIAVWRIEVHGRAAHAGLEPERGVNAAVELARLVGAVAAAGDPASGTTVTPTLLQAGNAANVVPATAEMTLDVRSFEQRTLDAVEGRLRGLRPTLEGASIDLRCLTSRPPLERAASAALFERAARIWRGLGSGELGAEAVGGASDGNLAAAVGAPTLDGLGPEGGEAHARGEWVQVTSLARRTALVAALVADLCERPARLTSAVPDSSTTE